MLRGQASRDVNFVVFILVEDQRRVRARPPGTNRRLAEQ